MNDTSYTLDSLQISFAVIDSCTQFRTYSTGFAPALWGPFAEEKIDTLISNIYSGIRFDKRFCYFNKDNPWASTTPLVIPDSSQSPIPLLQIILIGPCANLLHLESSLENAKNLFYDTTSRALSYTVDDLGWYYAGCNVGFASSQDSPNVSLDYTFAGWGPYSDSIVWDMGDGTLVRDTFKHSHRFAQPGYYQVCLTARDTFGCVGQRCVSVAVGLDTPVCVMDSVFAYLDRNKGKSAVMSFPLPYTGDSVRIEYGDGQSVSKQYAFQIQHHPYARPDTYDIMAIAYANRYNGYFQCADTAHAKVVIPEPEVAICAELGPGTEEDTLYFHVSNLTEDTLQMLSFSVPVWMDKSCLEIDGYHAPLTPYYKEFPPINPFFKTVDTVISETRNGILLERMTWFAHSAATAVDTNSVPVPLVPSLDSLRHTASLGFKGSCPTHFYLPEREEYPHDNVVLIRDPGGNGIPPFNYYALTEYACTSTVGLEPPVAGQRKLLLSPNPTEDIVLATLTGISPSRYHIRVRDVLGKEVIYWLRPLQEGIAIRLHLAHLPAGMYYVEIQDEARELPALIEPVVKR